MLDMLRVLCPRCQVKGIMMQIQGNLCRMSWAGVVRSATTLYRTLLPYSAELHHFAEDLLHYQPDTTVYLACDEGPKYFEALNMFEAGEPFGLVSSGDYEAAGNLPDIAGIAAVSAAERLTSSTNDCSRSGGSASMDPDNNSDAVYLHDSADDYVFPIQLPDPPPRSSQHGRGGPKSLSKLRMPSPQPAFYECCAKIDCAATLSLGSNDPERRAPPCLPDLPSSPADCN